MKFCSTILAAFALTITGCHSAPSPDPALGMENREPAVAQAEPLSRPAPPTNNRQPVPADHTIVCFGDSLTAGYGANEGQSYPDYLQADLDQLHYNYHVVNQGVSGNTTKDGIERLPDVLALHPYLVVVEFGGNDGLRGLPNEDTRANLDKIIATLKNSGAKIVLAGISLPPDYGPDYITAFNETYPLLAKKYHVPILPFLLQDVYGVPGMMQADRIHATAKGNQIVARNVLPLVTPFLKK